MVAIPTWPVSQSPVEYAQNGPVSSTTPVMTSSPFFVAQSVHCRGSLCTCQLGSSPCFPSAKWKLICPDFMMFPRIKNGIVSMTANSDSQNADSQTPDSQNELSQQIVNQKIQRLERWRDNLIASRDSRWNYSWLLAIGFGLTATAMRYNRKLCSVRN